MRARAADTSDVIGVEVGGAIKNVIAIAAGMSEGLGLGTNAMAALVTRGCGEMRRLVSVREGCVGHQPHPREGSPVPPMHHPRTQMPYKGTTGRPNQMTQAQQ